MVDFGDINVMLKFEQLLHIVSFELKNLLIFVIYDSDHLVLLLLDLFLKIHIVIGGSHQSNP